MLDTGVKLSHIFIILFLYQVEDLRSDTEESDEDLENLGQGTVDIKGNCVLNDSKSLSNNCQTASMNGGSFDRQNN